jgi:RHS repeat-associated protein
MTPWARRAQTDYAGVLEQTCASLPFGDALNCTNSLQFPTEHHFTGKERDAESGNDYFEARYYSSAMGRFMSPDWSAKEEPVPYATMNDPQSLNLYSYVRNNPLSRVDADGHCDSNGQNCSAWDHVAGAVAGVLNIIPESINLINSAGNAALSTFTDSRIPMLDTIQPDAHASAGGVATGEAMQVLLPVGDMSEGAQLLKGAETGAAKSSAISMSEAVDKAAAHVDGGVMEETGKGTNYQFRNTTTDASGNTVSKMGRFDVNPADPHVAKEGAHLNLETHVNGKPVGNEHFPIDPKTVRPGDHP